MFVSALLAVSLLTADAADNCKSCLNKDPYQDECQEPKNVKACFPRMSDDKCPPGTVPCLAFKCPPDSYERNGTTIPKSMADCVCDYGYHQLNNTCIKNKRTAASFVGSFLTPNSTTCDCAIGSTGYECRDPRDKACFPKQAGLCPAGTQVMPNCCSACAAGSAGKACQDPKDMACFPFLDAKTKECAPGTFPCPNTAPTPAPHKEPCDGNPALCGKMKNESYCGDSSDPDAIWSDGSGCSCTFNYHYSKKLKGCEPGSCDGHCHEDPARPCLKKVGQVCFGKTAGACPPGTQDCDYK